jgi:hypothetical protein
MTMLKKKLLVRTRLELAMRASLLASSSPVRRISFLALKYENH